MQESVKRNVHHYKRRHQRRKAWRNIVRVLACVVVFCTTYALILPAITMEKEAFCGVEAHVHEDACYGGQAAFVCDLAPDATVIHSHEEICYDGETLLCQLTELAAHLHSESCYETLVTPAHTHEESCYALQRGELLCTLEEVEGHTHGEGCYTAGDLLCQEAEREGHTHGEECRTFTCTLEESAGHTHGEGCDAECTLEESEGHSHGDDCYSLTCTLEEITGHTHETGCYAQVLTCTLEEMEGHLHSDDCYQMTEGLTCTLEEQEEHSEQVLTCTIPQIVPHAHNEGCYEGQTLICTLPEAIAHQHEESCLSVHNEAALICTLEVHEHSLPCFADPNADLETKAQWDEMIAKLELTGSWREDLLKVAKSQLGYNESTRNYIVGEDGETMYGYSRYGDWYGAPYGDWCAMYISFCIRYAGVEGMPIDANCPNWIRQLDHLGLYHSESDYIPESGDLVFFDWNGDGSSDHVGIVVEAADGKLKTIEGNAGDTVDYHKYDLTDSTIQGYGRLPEQNGEAEPLWLCGLEEHTHTETCYDAEGNLTCGAQEHSHTEQCTGRKLVYTDGTLQAFVTIKGVAELPDDLSVEVWQITADNDPAAYDAMFNALSAQMSDQGSYLSQANCYGMELYSQDAPYALPESAKVSVEVEFIQPLFDSETMEASSGTRTYLLTPEASAQEEEADGGISLMRLFSLRSGEETPVYQAEEVTAPNYTEEETGLTGVRFSTGRIASFAVAVSAQTQTGDFWQRVYSTDADIVGDGAFEQDAIKEGITNGTYMIVSAEGSYALAVNGNNVAAVPVDLNPVKGNPQYFTITDSDGNEIKSDSTALCWNFNGSGSSFKIQNANNSKYLSVGRNLSLGTSGNSHTLQFAQPEKCWRISNGSNYLRKTGTSDNFTAGSGNDSATTGTLKKSVTRYYSRDMMLFKLVNTTLEIPDDVVANNTGSNDTQVIPDRPDYGQFVTPSGSKSGETAVYELVDGELLPGVTGQYWSDPATSNVEKNYRPAVADPESDAAYAASQHNDGKVMTDKSVIYGDDDYGAFETYGANTFGVTLSALGQEYPVELEDVVETPLDVVFVLDVSGSMTTNTGEDGRTRMTILSEAFNDAATKILDHGTKQNRIGVAIYSSGAWEMLPLDRYTADRNADGIMQLTEIETHTLPYGGVPKEFLVGTSSLKSEAGVKYDNAGYTGELKDSGDIFQGIGTYTQAGIATGYEIFKANTDTTYTTTVGFGENARECEVQRQPVFILLSDGEPTHATSNYMDPLNGPHYSDGQAESKDNPDSSKSSNNNVSGAQGYYTVLSANYFKRMVGIHYQMPAKFYTIGMGIKTDDDLGFGVSDQRTQPTGDMYKRAVLNPTVENVTNLSSTLNQTTTKVADTFRRLMLGTFTDHQIQTQSNWPDPWYGVNHVYLPVLSDNPYATDYSYADGAYFGKMSQTELTEIFSEIVNKSYSETEYGFVLFERSYVEMTDRIGHGMEVKGTPVLRYNGKNYYDCKVTTGTDSATGESYSQYTYSGTYVNPYRSDRTAKLSDIIVRIYTQADGSQRVYMKVPDSALPVYFPEITGKQFYYEELPVRLIYQVGLTAESEQAVLDLREGGGELTFYTNQFGEKTNSAGETVPDPYADAVLHPSLYNPFYHDQYDRDENGNFVLDANGNKILTSEAKYEAHHNHKTENTTDTSDHHVDCQRTIELVRDSTGNEVEVVEVTHDLGNNGKLTFRVDTMEVKVTKNWVDVDADTQDPVDVKLYTVSLTAAENNIYTAISEVATLNLKKSYVNAENWKGAFTDVARPAEDQYYAVVEVLPEYFLATYGENEIKLILENAEAPVRAALVTFTETGEPEPVGIINVPTRALPRTGGAGTTLYIAGGLLLMTISAGYLLYSHKKRRKGAY